MKKSLAKWPLLGRLVRLEFHQKIIFVPVSLPLGKIISKHTYHTYNTFTTHFHEKTLTISFPYGNIYDDKGKL